MTLKEIVQQAAKDNGIEGVMALVEFTGVPYNRVIKIWRGDTNARLSDYVLIMSKLGMQLKWSVQ